MNPTIIDLNKIDTKKPETTEETQQMKEAVKLHIENYGLKGFFNLSQSPKPTGIVFNYDVEATKKEIEKMNEGEIT